MNANHQQSRNRAKMNFKISSLLDLRAPRPSRVTHSKYFSNISWTALGGFQFVFAQFYSCQYIMMYMFSVIMLVGF